MTAMKKGASAACSGSDFASDKSGMYLFFYFSILFLSSNFRRKNEIYCLYNNDEEFLIISVLRNNLSESIEVSQVKHIDMRGEKNKMT